MTAKIGRNLKHAYSRYEDVIVVEKKYLHLNYYSCILSTGDVMCLPDAYVGQVVNYICHKPHIYPSDHGDELLIQPWREKLQVVKAG